MITHTIGSSNRYKCAKWPTLRKFRTIRCSSKKMWSETTRLKSKSVWNLRVKRPPGIEWHLLSVPNSALMKRKLQRSPPLPSRSHCHQQVRERSDLRLRRWTAAGHRLVWMKRTTLLTIKCHTMVPRRLEVRDQTCGHRFWVRQATVTARNLTQSHSLKLQCPGPKILFQVLGWGTWRLRRATPFNSKVRADSVSIQRRSSSVWLRKKTCSWLTKCTGRS